MGGLIPRVPGRLLTERIGVLRATKVEAAGGGWTETWAQVATVPGAVYTMTQQTRTENVDGSQPANRELINFALDVASFTVLPSDRLSAEDGTFEIVTLQRQQSAALIVARRVA